MKKIIYLFGAIVLGTVSAIAQGPAFNMLQGNPDVRTSALGDVHLGMTDRMYIYTNPSALLKSDKSFNVDFSTEIFPASDEGTLMHYNLGAGYKINSMHAVLAGFRYTGGLSFPLSLTATPSSEMINAYEWAADLGYTYAVNTQWMVYATGTYVMSYLNQSASAYLFSAGASYNTLTTLMGKDAILTLGAKLSDVGPSFQYTGSDTKYSTPMSVELGGDMSMQLAPKHNIAWALGARYIIPESASQMLVGTGIEYMYDNMLALRAGYQYGSKAGSNIGLGLGAKFYGIKLDAGYNIAIGNSYGVNTLMVGIGYDF